MKRKDLHLKLRKLSLSVGDFIRYWGFRRIHGAIWTQIYLSSEPLSCTELAKRLGLSKALISPALDELSQYRLIQETASPNEKTKLFIANEDIDSVIKAVLQERESRLLKLVSENFASFDLVDHDGAGILPSRVKSLGEMIGSANLMLQALLDQDFLLTELKELPK